MNVGGVIGRRAHPEIRALFRIVAPDVVIVDRTYGGNAVEIGNLVEVGVVATSQRFDEIPSSNRSILTQSVVPTPVASWEDIEHSLAT